eukprot:jgi/Mesvir1/4020/Mv08155-RA.1
MDRQAARRRIPTNNATGYASREEEVAVAEVVVGPWGVAAVWGEGLSVKVEVVVVVAVVLAVEVEEIWAVEAGIRGRMGAEEEEAEGVADVEAFLEVARAGVAEGPLGGNGGGWGGGMGAGGGEALEVDEGAVAKVVVEAEGRRKRLQRNKWQRWRRLRQ